MVISDGVRAEIDREIARYPQKRGALLPALHILHRELGHVSPETAGEVAEIFDLRPIDVMEVISFYNMFFTSPQPRHHVRVCTNLPCSLGGARTLMRQLESHLGVMAGQSTPDGRISLGHEECLGACAYAPMMRVDHQYHEYLDAAQAKRILDALD